MLIIFRRRTIMRIRRVVLPEAPFPMITDLMLCIEVAYETLTKLTKDAVEQAACLASAPRSCAL